MTWTVALAPRAQKDLRKMDGREAARVTAAVDRVARAEHADVRKITDADPPEWRLRVGRWRVRFTYDTPRRELVVLRVRPRPKAY